MLDLRSIVFSVLSVNSANSRYLRNNIRVYFFLKHSCFSVTCGLETSWTRGELYVFNSSLCIFLPSTVFETMQPPLCLVANSFTSFLCAAKREVLFILNIPLASFIWWLLSRRLLETVSTHYLFAISRRAKMLKTCIWPPPPPPRLFFFKIKSPDLFSLTQKI